MTTPLLTAEDFQAKEEVLLDENGEPAGTRTSGPIPKLIEVVISLSADIAELRSRVAKLEEAGPESPTTKKAKPKGEAETS